MPTVLVSACLLGQTCRFDGGHKRSALLEQALERGGVTAVPFCPEEAGGLGTPRPPAILRGGDGDAVLDGQARVVTEAGRDVTDAFVAGAEACVARAREAGCAAAYLKERSPSCGCARIHTERGVTAGRGVAAAALLRSGIPVISIE